ncbi:hypothetical protein [Chishuiella sp.]|uniref:hypothetical protein n=1 Tax=Chishuiella sp. TaxID=1969467 RepID=UPI0028A9AAE8|nr:hypothetical protein [Chishuiella sp.]
MYIGSTAKERKDHFIVIENDDIPENIFQLMQEKQIFNLIIDGNTCDVSVLISPEFIQIFEHINIVHLSNIVIKKSEFLYILNKVIRLEIKGCKYIGKEPINWLMFTRLEELFTIYSKRFQNLFRHPTLKTIFLEKFSEENFEFPQNKILETFSIEKSVTCDWSSLINFRNLKALYFVEIKSLIYVYWLQNFKSLQEIDLSLCKNVENIIEEISKIKTLTYIHIYQSGIITTLQSLSKLENLQELIIDNKGILQDKNIKFLNDSPNLEYNIEVGTFSAGNN